MSHLIKNIIIKNSLFLGDEDLLLHFLYYSFGLSLDDYFPHMRILGLIYMYLKEQQMSMIFKEEINFPLLFFFIILNKVIFIRFIIQYFI